MNLTGKVAIVTGAAQGLGKGFSDRLLQRGVRVFIADIKEKEAQTTLLEFAKKYGKDRATFVKCDVAVEQDLEDLFAAVRNKSGRLDIVVNNAGICHETNWSKMIDINLKGVIKGTQLAIKEMRTDKGGHGGLIINMASAAGLTPVFISPSYAASKFGVVGFTLSWAQSQSYIDHGIKFAVMCPAFTDTDIIKPEGGSDFVLPEFSGALINTVGISKIDTVCDAFMQLVDDPHSNGTTAVISARHGIKLKRLKPMDMSKL